MRDWRIMIKALVFDFDGLILETEQPLYQSWQELYWANGLELPFEKWALNIGTAEEPFDPIHRAGKPAGLEPGEEPGAFPASAA